MLAAIAVLVSAQLPEPNLQAWQTSLRKVASVERASLCVDVDLAVKPGPIVYEKPEGRMGLERVAAATSRTMDTVEGVYVFRRKPVEDDLRFHSPHQHAMAFLTSLGVTDTIKLSDGKLDFSNVSPAFQRRLRYAIASLGNGLGDSMLANYPSRIGMRLLFEPVATASSRTGDGFVTVSLVTEKPDVPFPMPSRTTEASPLGRPGDGEVDFQDGAVFALREIVERAQRTFGTAYWYDARLAESRIFISGTFTEERLRKVLDAVTEPFPLTPIPAELTKPDFSHEKRQVIDLAYGLMGIEKIGVSDVTYNHLILGRITSFKELFGSRPPRHIQQFMSNYRIQPDDEVSVAGELYLAFAAPGLAVLDTGTRDSLGKPVPYSVPHFVKFAF